MSNDTVKGRIRSGTGAMDRSQSAPPTRGGLGEARGGAAACV